MASGRAPRVLIDLSVAPVGGAGTSAAGLAVGIAAGDLPDKDQLVVLVDADWAVANRASVGALEEAGVLVDAQRFPPPGTWRARLGRGRRLRSTARRHQVDAAFFPREVAPSMAVPVAIEAKNLYAWMPFGSSSAIGGRAAGAALRWAAHRSARRAAVVIAVSRSIADQLPPEVVVDAVVHHGCSLPADDRHDRPAADDDPRRLVMVGNAIENKRFEVAIEAVGRLRRDGRLVQLDVFGGRSDAAYAERLDALAEAELGETVLRGPVPADRLADAYRGADLFVMAGSFESFCLPLVEAMRSGCVVVAPECDLVAELCGDVAVTYQEGDVASLADALDRAWVERAERIERGVARSQAFDWADAASRIVGLVRAAAR